MAPRNRLRGWLLAGMSACLAACAVGPDYKRPPVAAADGFKEVGGWKPTEPADALARGPWWHIFNDATLSQLEDQVDISALERRDEIGTRLYPGYFAGEMIRLEVLSDQLRIAGIVLQQENPRNRRHDYLLMLPGGGSLITAQNTPSSLMALTNSWKSTGFTT